MLLLTAVTFAQTAPPVVNGHRADDGAWPDAAGIVFNSQYVGCTGTLIHPRIVLTAGHCIGGISHVILDSTDWYQNGGEFIEVKQQIEYPNSAYTYDLGIVILKEEAKAEPRLIADDCILDEEYLHNGAEVAIVGYGATDYYGEQNTSKLMEGFTTIDDYDCSDSYGCNNSVSPGGELGAGGADNVDACFGDSGGPLYLLTDRGDFLIGATSRGYYDTSVPCRDGGIYGRPDAIRSWIENKSGYELPTFVCNTPPETVDRMTIDVIEGERVVFDLEAEDEDGDELEWDVVGELEVGQMAFDGDRGRYSAPDDSAGTYYTTLEVSDGTDTDTVELRIRVAEAGCGCSATPGPLGASAVTMLLGLVALRRRR